MTDASTAAVKATAVAAAPAPVLSPVSPGAWTLDVSQQATVLIDTVPGIARLLPALATPPAHLTVPEIPFSTDGIDPMTPDADGRVHSDGT